MAPFVLFLLSFAVASGLRRASVPLTAIWAFALCAFLIVIELTANER
jgi:hypothetical protein